MLDVDRMYLRPKDVARELGLTDSAIYKMIHRGELPSVRFGRAVRIPAPAFEAWRKACETGHWEIVRDGDPSVASDSDDRRAAFEERVGMSPERFVTAWRAGDVRDDGESTTLMIEALSLREGESPRAAVYEPAVADAVG